MENQTVFSRAVGYHLSLAIPVQLDRADEFAVGKVLLYNKKPRTLLPWRKHQLNFTGYSLSDLLADGSATLKFATSSNFFDAGQGSETVDTKLGLDAELRDALFKLKPQIQAKHELQTTITTDFGKITQTVADCSPLLSDQAYSLNTSHPVVKEAIEKGATLFIISTLYEAEQCRLSIMVTENESDTVQTGHGALPHGNGIELQDATRFHGTVQVADRNMRTPLGFLLHRLTIDGQGELKPELTLNRSTMTNSDWALGSLVASSFLPTALTGIHIQVSPAGSMTSLDSIGSQEMVMVDSTKEDPNRDEHEPAVNKALEDTAEQAEKKLVHVPSVEVTSAMGETEEVNFEPLSPVGDHYTHGLKDFQVFTGCTYEDILTEVKKWLEPLLAEPDLQKAFLEFINHCKPPNTYENLQNLSKYLKQLGDALRTDRNYPPPNKDTELTPVLQVLSSDRETELDQITAIILAAEACSEFPLHTLRKMLALDQEKRTTVLNLVKRTPYGTNRHVFSDEGPFRDPDLYPVLTKMGYSCPEQHLIYAADDMDSDMPAAASTVIMIASPHPQST